MIGLGGNADGEIRKSASKNVKSAMHRRKKGTLKSGSGRKVKSRKQAIAIGLSEARKKGAKVPKRKLVEQKARAAVDAVVEILGRPPSASDCASR